MAKSTKSQSTPTPRTTGAKKPSATPDTTTIQAATLETTTPTLPHDLIAMRAYELYLGDGAPQGRDVEHWLRAESELRARASRN
jgi:DUF2934 family protein